MKKVGTNGRRLLAALILGSVILNMVFLLGAFQTRQSNSDQSVSANMALADPGSARILTEQLALTAAASELKRLGQGVVSDAFVETRLGGLWRNTYGMLDNRHNAMSIIDQLFSVT